jgi:hypothetical protein
MSDTTELGQEFLEHYGVKGMRWGKSGGTASIKGPSTAKLKKSVGTVSFKKKDPSPSEVSVTAQLKGKKYKTKAKGGEKQPITEDAVRAHTSRQKLKKSGVDALSNKELQDLSTRMNLEQQVNSLNSRRPKTKGQEFVNKALKDPQKTYETAAKGAETLQKLRK